MKQFNDRLAMVLGDRIATMTAFYVLVVWQLGWITLSLLHVGPFGADHYPFAFLLFLGNLIQLWYLPLLQYTSKRQEQLLEEVLKTQAAILEILQAEEETELVELEQMEQKIKALAIDGIVEV